LTCEAARSAIAKSSSTLARARGDMVDADLIEGDLKPAIARLFANPEAAYIHAHYAKRGCYAARIDRA
jgi:Protein of unknown function (DUF1203)